MKKERGILFKSYTIFFFFLKNVRLLPQSPFPLADAEKNPTALCQISSRLNPEFLLPFNNTALGGTGVAAERPPRQLSWFPLAVQLQAPFWSLPAHSLHHHTTTSLPPPLLLAHRAQVHCQTTQSPEPTHPGTIRPPAGYEKGRSRGQTLSALCLNFPAQNSMHSRSGQHSSQSGRFRLAGWYLPIAAMLTFRYTCPCDLLFSLQSGAGRWGRRVFPVSITLTSLQRLT